jgi:Fic-DOC domain mobile mystery protein B
MDLLGEEDGQTPLDPDEMGGLIPTHLQTRGQLNEWEGMNIEKALKWAFSSRRKGKMTDMENIFNLHKKMFNETWEWAGEARKTEKSIGVEPHKIFNSMIQFLKDAEGWVEWKSFPMDEIAYRYHHKLVKIHVFPNGNGRHARLATDMLLIENQAERFTWGSSLKKSPEEVRSMYLGALRKADAGTFSDLAEFVRS